MTARLSAMGRPIAWARERLSRLSLGELATLGLVALTLGAIIHLASILAIPALATRHADARLAALAPRLVLTVLPRVRAQDEADALPFRDPAAALAVCRFDLAEGPVRVRAPVGEVFLSAAFHVPAGGVFYALTDRGAARGRIDVLIVTAEQLAALQAEDLEDEPVSELRVVSPRPSGFVTLRAVAPEPGQLAEAEALLARAQCTREPMAPARLPGGARQGPR